MYTKKYIYICRKTIILLFCLKWAAFWNEWGLFKLWNFFNGTKTSYMSKDQVKFDFSCHCALSQWLV